MHILALHEKVQLAAPAAAYTHSLALVLLAGLAVLSFCFVSFRVALLGQGRGYAEWLLRMLVVLGCLAAYDTVVWTMLDLSDHLATYFVEQAGWDQYWRDVAEQMHPLLEGSESSAWDRLVGWLKGGALSVAVSISYYLEFMVFELVRHLAAVFAAALYVFGPLMIAGGVLGSGGALGHWFSALVQVMLWPSVPPFLMLVIVGTSGNAISTGNASYIIAQNFVLVVLGLGTPAVVSFAVGRGGLGVLAAAAIGAGAQTLRVATMTARSWGPSVAGMEGAAAGLAGAGGRGSPHAGPGPLAPPGVPVPRADDRLPAYVSQEPAGGPPRAPPAART